MGKIKGENIVDGFFIFSQIAFFTAIFVNYLTNTRFPQSIFIWVAGFLLIMSIVTWIIKINIKSK